MRAPAPGLRRSGDRPRADGDRAGRPNGGGERVDGGSRRNDIVDERDVPARVVQADRECALDVPAPVGELERRLGCRRSSAANSAHVERDGELRRYDPRDLRGLVVAALAKPRLV